MSFLLIAGILLGHLADARNWREGWIDVIVITVAVGFTIIERQFLSHKSTVGSES